MDAKRLKGIGAALVGVVLTLAPAVRLSAAVEWDLLDEFTPLPSGIARLSERYVAVPFVDNERRRFAAVFFRATCAVGGCELHHRAGYAITDARGSFLRWHVEPQEAELLALIRDRAQRFSRQP